MKRIAVVYGTRPEAIKVAPVVDELRRADDVDAVVISTGQHREMLTAVEEVFDLAPDERLDVMRPGQSLNALFARVLTAVDAVLEAVRPDLVMVHGDTTTAAASALAAHHREIPVVHLEAGLRSEELWNPFPEEGNRRLITRMSQVHLAPTERARRNLLAENVPDDEISVTGNTVIDALHDAARRTASSRWPAGLAHLDDSAPTEHVVLVTLHRRENQAGAIGMVSAAIAQFAAEHDDIRVVFPMHRNPTVRTAVIAALGSRANVDLIEPVDYPTMVRLLARAWVIVTDSGGIQEEAPAFGVPVLVARDTTERPEAIEAGVARLVGGDGARLLAQLRLLHEDPAEWAAMARAVNPFGDGQAAVRVVDAVRRRLHADALS